MGLKDQPQYRKLYESLRKQIVDGFYKEGDLLPSENDLCILHNLTRPTVRKSLDMLLHEGFIKKHQGLGSVVHKLPKGIGILSVTGTTTAIGGHRLITKAIVKPRVQHWPDKFPFVLSEHEQHVGCIYFERLRLLNDTPVFYEFTYLPNINLPRFTSRNLDNKSLFDLLRQSYNIEIKGGEQFIKAISVEDENVCQYLHVEKGHPVLHMKRKLDTNRIGFAFYSMLYCNTDEYNIYGIF
ncbi:GntR family transcriptional regulator [Alkalitalea saponilacus]|uniref:GntR family transcriptional regulator n=1 Tax=Alkalitalea saponilacus TaxID=889453 RepID=A0A1T5G487_9BACT|nr:GntR family transcriptional regulator [Alkalitalea saponilacus]ASB47848.1 GntR family transcriptional regulator [Alkalitalea saponilacus]SKC03149.1 GntR family transcriptional regulator [Alkalitalea saponilacus]